MQFLSKEHETRFYTLVGNDKTSTGDVERYALFYILAGSDEMWQKSSRIYDCKKHMLASGRTKVVFSSSGERLMKLGINLFNSYHKADVCDTFSRLDSSNRKLALNAIQIRFTW